MIDERGRDVARALALWYTVAATAILAVSGLLGVLMRDSQAGLGRLRPDFFYAIMTAHGLGAFLGWAGFAVMGLAWWVLASVGFPVRGAGLLLARLTWWLMVTGVLGIVVSTLLLDFGASWVFLYPLPLHGAGAWGEWATAVFSASALLAGLAIVTWCLGILHTVLGPALHAVSRNWANRYGVAIGLGYLWPRRFATNPTAVPYPVIPLAVIALDMIVATLPLAVLLVIQLVQAFAPSVSVDPLLAKNVLWWFGHPVVYLLLFPAAALYYLLVPRYAGRPLVAGNVIALAWGIAAIANVVVWAHHVYLDYPEGSVQGAINTAMQPTTFALVLPSALSLYSLGFTIYRSSFRWTPASTALFLGLVGWLLAGLSGIVNATIALDVAVHNTLWIVGHFHHMALLNIGLLVFGATYALLPELTGKALYSERLAWTHVWLTFSSGMVVFGLWLVQGLNGAPRRFAVLPHEYDTLTRVSIPFVFVLALAQAPFFWNVLQTLRGKGGVATFDERGIPERARRPAGAWTVPALEGAIVLVSLGLAFAVGVAGFFLGRDSRAPAGHTVTVTVTSGGTGAAAGDTAAGARVFASAGCGACHTLAAAGSKGTVGPRLDGRALAVSLVEDRVRNGKGAMPSFEGRLSERQIRDVAAFVAQGSGQ
ncbi:MAG TPA: cbb3-type cytochrome c oxidase subunit I [Gaiellaceae bacterium]|nr:cbb3-type cytochrome c oxidase subunit I [Gaiellaceae bacterium]